MSYRGRSQHAAWVTCHTLKFMDSMREDGEHSGLSTKGMHSFMGKSKEFLHGSKHHTAFEGSLVERVRRIQAEVPEACASVQGLLVREQKRTELLTDGAQSEAARIALLDQDLAEAHLGAEEAVKRLVHASPELQLKLFGPPEVTAHSAQSALYEPWKFANQVPMRSVTALLKEWEAKFSRDSDAAERARQRESRDGEANLAAAKTVKKHKARKPGKGKAAEATFKGTSVPRWFNHKVWRDEEESAAPRGAGWTALRTRSLTSIAPKDGAKSGAWDSFLTRVRLSSVKLSGEEGGASPSVSPRDRPAGKPPPKPDPSATIVRAMSANLKVSPRTRARLEEGGDQRALFEPTPIFQRGRPLRRRSLPAEITHVPVSQLLDVGWGFRAGCPTLDDVKREAPNGPKVEMAKILQFSDLPSVHVTSFAVANSHLTELEGRVDQLLETIGITEELMGGDTDEAGGTVFDSLRDLKEKVDLMSSHHRLDLIECAMRVLTCQLEQLTGVPLLSEPVDPEQPDDWLPEKQVEALYHDVSATLKWSSEIPQIVTRLKQSADGGEYNPLVKLLTQLAAQEGQFHNLDAVMTNASDSIKELREVTSAAPSQLSEVKGAFETLLAAPELLVYASNKEKLEGRIENRLATRAEF
eukprot:Selendium_serpulae@DN2721_c0_g1_i1.p1